MFKLALLTYHANELMISYDNHLFRVFSNKLKASLVYVVNEYHFLTGMTRIININLYRHVCHQMHYR